MTEYEDTETYLTSITVLTEKGERVVCVMMNKDFKRELVVEEVL